MKFIFTFCFFIMTLGVTFSQQLNKIKSFEKNFIRIRPALYACKFETSNSDFNTFLQSLLLSKDTALYNMYRYDSTAWNNNWSVQYGEPFLFSYNSHPAYADHPVNNISFESAVAYCRWLTEMYNNTPGRTFHKVLFRLPLAEEWFDAAAPLNDNFLPWPGTSACNKKCMYYANLKYHPASGKNEADYMADGGEYTMKVKSFKPNKNGLYNIIGNVAEMLAVRGNVKGGSWDSFLEDARINITSTFDGPCPQVGFRVFMQLVEP